jgi:RNA polymerase sigma factor (sigma-70 family)
VEETLRSAVTDPISVEIQRFHAGDPVAAEALARRACRLALRTAVVILHSREEASDVAQDVAVDVLGSLSKLRDPQAFDAWVHRITVRHALRTARRRRTTRARETPLALIADGEEPLAYEESDHGALLDARATLAAALADLPPRQQLAIALRYVHDLSDAEIAAALGCRVGTAHSLLSRGRAGLRRNPIVAELAPATRPGGSG